MPLLYDLANLVEADWRPGKWRLLWLEDVSGADDNLVLTKHNNYNTRQARLQNEIAVQSTEPENRRESDTLEP